MITLRLRGPRRVAALGKMETLFRRYASPRVSSLCPRLPPPGAPNGGQCTWFVQGIPSAQRGGPAHPRLAALRLKSVDAGTPRGSDSPSHGGFAPGGLAFVDMGDIADFACRAQYRARRTVATVWLDRPEARTPWAWIWRDLPLAMSCRGRDTDVRAVVMAAKGPHFSVGLDLKAMGAFLTGGATNAGAADGSSSGSSSPFSAPGLGPHRGSPTARCHYRGRPLPQARDRGGPRLLHRRWRRPVAACDIRLASADAVFSVREAKMAIVADLGSLQRLPAIISAGHLAELAYTAKDIAQTGRRRSGW